MFSIKLIIIHKSDSDLGSTVYSLLVPSGQIRGEVTGNCSCAFFCDNQHIDTPSVCCGFCMELQQVESSDAAGLLELQAIQAVSGQGLLCSVRITCSLSMYFSVILLFVICICFFWLIEFGVIFV